MEIPRDQRGFMYADKVIGNDKLVGAATSRGYSYYFRKMLSLSLIDVDWSDREPKSSSSEVNRASRKRRFERRLQPRHTRRITGKIDVTSL